MTIDQKRVFALLALHLVRQAIGVAIAHGVLISVLWVDETETLNDRLDRCIADLENIELAVPFVPDEVAATLAATRNLLQLAAGTGVLRSTLWASSHEPLAEYLAHAIETLRLPELEAA